MRKQTFLRLINIEPNVFYFAVQPFHKGYPLFVWYKPNIEHAQISASRVESFTRKIQLVVTINDQWFVGSVDSDVLQGKITGPIHRIFFFKWHFQLPLLGPFICSPLSYIIYWL